MIHKLTIIQHPAMSIPVCCCLSPYFTNPTWHHNYKGWSRSSMCH